MITGLKNGVDGAQGPTGPTGPAGSNGTNGTNGAQGPTGPAGTNGTNGAQGPTGPAGTNGTNGTNGAQGPTGPAGTNGAQGPTGPAGTNGTNGAQGPTGPAGTNGTNGTNGAQGPTGPAGTNGTNGTNGAQGPTGPTGPAPDTNNFVTTNLSTVQTIGGGKIFSADVSFNSNVFVSVLTGNVNKITERLTNGTINANVMSLSYTEINGIIFCTPSSANNFSINFTNVPTTLNTTYTFTLLINTATNKNYCNSVSVNGGTAFTSTSTSKLVAVGGLSNISIESVSMPYILQQISIIFTITTTPTTVITSISTVY
jgi:hypothetical protein